MMGEILFLAHRIPFPPDRGDKIRAHHLLKHLANAAPVHVGSFSETEADRAAECELASVAASHCLAQRNKPLALAGVEAVLASKPVSLTAFHSRRLANWVNETLEKHPIDTIFVFSGQMGQYIPPDYAGQVIVDLCDVDSVKFEDYAKAGERVWLNQREGQLLSQEEERLVHRADTTLLISENEKSVLQTRLRNAAGVRIRAIGNGIDADYFDPAIVTPSVELREGAGPNLIFTGQMDYRPNEQAAIWTIERLLPLLRERFGDASFHIVGRNPTAKLSEYSETPGVRVWGEVADVRPFLAAADLAIVPLTIARGVQNKVLEAMAMELPVLLTPQAAAGIDAEDARHWFVEESDPVAMVDRFEELWRDKANVQNVARAARRFVVEQHAWPAMLAPLDEMIGKRSESRDAA